MTISAMRKENKLIFNAAGIVHLREQTHISRNTARGLLGRSVERGELVELFRGTYVDARVWPSISDFPQGVLAIKAELARARIQCIAIAQSHPDRVLTGPAAALIHGLPLLDIPRTLTLSSSVKNGASKLRTYHELQFHQQYRAFDNEHVTTIDGARVTTLARTVVDIAAAQPHVDDASRRKPEIFRRFAEAIALADGALRGSVGTLGAAGATPQQTQLWPDAPPRFRQWRTNSLLPAKTRLLI